MSEPTFELVPKLHELRKSIFSLWRAQDYRDENWRIVIPRTDIEEFFTACLLVPNNKILLLGDPGAGKTVLIELIAKALGAKYAKVTGAPEKTAQKVIARVDVGKLVKEGVEKYIVRDFVTANIKFINEINRFSLEVQDALLSLLWEGMIEIGGQIFRTPPYIAFADMNPYRGDIDRALKSRFYFSCWIPMPGLLESVEIELKREELKVDEFTEAIKEPILSWNELMRAWEDVKKVQVDPGAVFLAKMILYSFSGCIYQDWSPDFKRPCGDCEFNEGVCKYINRPVDQRALKAAIRLAKARAWLRKRKRIEYNDIVWALTFSVPHRLEFTPMAKATIAQPMTWLRKTIDEVIKTKYVQIKDGKVQKGIWWRAIILWNAIVANDPSIVKKQLEEIGLSGNITKAKVLSELRRLNEESKDLVVHTLYSQAYQIYTKLTEAEDRRIFDMINELIKEGSRESLQKAGTLIEEIVNEELRLKALKAVEAAWKMLEVEVVIDEKKLAKIMAKIGIPVKEATEFLKQYRNRLEHDGWILIKEGDNLKIQAPNIQAMEQLQPILKSESE